MTQTYADPVAIDRMREDRCPECGKFATDHSAAQEFWLRDPLGCSLLPQGVVDRIAKQRALDAEANA